MFFDGAEVFVVAGGPSLRGFDWRRLDGRRVIAINRAYEVLPGAEALWWSDARFFRNHRAGLMAHGAALKATFAYLYEDDELPKGVLRYKLSGQQGFDPDQNALRSGNNSTYAAIHLAAHLGARRIVILGLDMKHGPSGETHWHDGHKGLLNPAHVMESAMLPLFSGLVGPLEQRGIEVVNANPGSALEVWPRIAVDQALPPCNANAPTS